MSDEINSGALFACLKFSLDGTLLLAVAEGRIYLLDSFDGRLVQKVSHRPCFWWVGTLEAGGARHVLRQC